MSQSQGCRRISKLVSHLNTESKPSISTNHASKEQTETYPLSPFSKCTNLSGKTIFITGASRGIGLAVAKRCAIDGCNIVIAAKTAAPHPKLPGTIYSAAKEIEAINNSKCLPVICDIRKEEMVKNAVQKAVDRFGGIDILVNNASAISVTDTEHTTMKKYDLMHDVNARGTYLVTKYCLPYLKKSNKNAHILIMSPPIPDSIKPEVFAGKVAYITAKIGMSLCTLGWSKEFRKYGIGVNSIWPRTTIATMAIKNVLGGDAMMKRSRTPEVHSDAAYQILIQPNNKMNGYFVWDEDILKQSGIRDFAKYKFDENVDEKDILRTSNSMALKRSNLQQIPQRNKDLAFGFVRECDNTIFVIPELVKYLCLLYFNANKDEFDSINIDKQIEIKNNCIMSKLKPGDVVRNTYLMNTVSKNIHEWTFKINTIHKSDLIGISKVIKSENPVLKLCYIDNTKDGICTGYGFQLNGKLTNPQHPNRWGDAYGVECDDGDIVKMRVDFNSLTLSYTINNIDYGKAFDIEATEYRAAISIYYDSSYTLISYQQIY